MLAHMTSRTTTNRNRWRSALSRGHPPCALCGQPIDYAAQYPSPLSFVVDHITPLARGGSDTRSNVQPAHAECNARKGPRGGDLVLRRSGSLRM